MKYVSYIIVACPLCTVTFLKKCQLTDPGLLMAVYYIRNQSFWWASLDNRIICMHDEARANIQV